MPKSFLASYSTRRRWTAADARTALAAFEASGLSVSAFASREGLDVQRLYFWKRRLETITDEGTVAPAFVEVRHSAVGQVDVVLRSGRVLRVPESIDGASLRRLVDALEQDPGC